MSKPVVPIVGDLKLWKAGADHLAKAAPQLNSQLVKLGAFPQMTPAARSKLIDAVAAVLKKMPEVQKYTPAQMKTLAHWVWTRIQGQQFIGVIFGAIFRSRL